MTRKTKKLGAVFRTRIISFSDSNSKDWNSSHCMKSVQIRSFFLVRIWTLFTQYPRNYTIIRNIHVNKPQTSNYFLRYTWYFILDISYYFVREGSLTFTQKFTISLKGDIVLGWRPCLTEMITDIFCVFF